MQRTYSASVPTAIARWLDLLEAELVAQAGRHGPLRGRVGAGQKPYSLAIDAVELARQELACFATSRLGLGSPIAIAMARAEPRRAA